MDVSHDLAFLDLVGQLAGGPVAEGAARLLRRLTGHRDDLDHLLGCEGGRCAGSVTVVVVGWAVVVVWRTVVVVWCAVVGVAGKNPIAAQGYWVWVLPKQGAPSPPPKPAGPPAKLENTPES